MSAKKSVLQGRKIKAIKVLYVSVFYSWLVVYFTLFAIQKHDFIKREKKDLNVLQGRTFATKFEYIFSNSVAFISFINI